MLDFKEFIENIRERLQMALEENHKVVIKRERWVNQVELTYLTIKWDTTGESPRTCLEQYYEMYRDAYENMCNLQHTSICPLPMLPGMDGINPFFREDLDDKDQDFLFLCL